MNRGDQEVTLTSGQWVRVPGERYELLLRGHHIKLTVYKRWGAWEIPYDCYVREYRPPRHDERRDQPAPHKTCPVCGRNIPAPAEL